MCERGKREGRTFRATRWRTAARGWRREDGAVRVAPNRLRLP
jgi:hypothetical protein